MIRKGFTLAELLVVMFIIGILAAIVVVNVSESRKKARDARRIADVKTLKTAVEQYATDNTEYPQPHGPCTSFEKDEYGNDGYQYDVSCLTKPLVPYLSPMIVNPKGTNYQYIRGVPGTNGYGILVQFEKKTVSGYLSCKTGNEMVTGWFTAQENPTVPLCDF